MAKAIFNRRFDATDIKRGVSIRIEPGEAPQEFPDWVIVAAEKAGAATRVTSPKKPATSGAIEKEQ